MIRPSAANTLDLAAFTGPLGSPLDIPPAKVPTDEEREAAKVIRLRLLSGESPKEIDPYRWYSVDDLLDGAPR